MSELKDLLIFQEQSISIFTLFINFSYCVFFSFILRFIFVRSASSLIAHSHIANIIPILSIIVFLVIMVVKSSIALSLGLVGALSIVRFRTPIKEPEELIYLFFAIAIGLGFGAGQSLLTSFIVITTMIFLYFFYGKTKKIGFNNNYNLSLECEHQDNTLHDLEKLISQTGTDFQIISLNSEDQKLFINIILSNPNPENIDKIFKQLSELFPKASINLSEQMVNW